PGGGSAAAASGAMAAGLASMVASMSRGKKAWVQYESRLGEAVARLAALREELTAAIDADAEAYNGVVKAYRAAKEAADGGKGVRAALEGATSVPLGVAERAAEVERIAGELKPMTNPRMSSDLATAMALARAAVTGALANVEVNLESMRLDLSKLDLPEGDAGDVFVEQTRRRAEALTAPA
ncbi:MAG: cyclodeaminase/cyclohydrolase family protein, partial [Terracidiphilus sp.]